ERAIEPLARAIAGEDAAGAVAAVRGGRQADDDQARARVAEAGQRPPPIVLAGERGALLARHSLAPRDQPRALSTLDDGRVVASERLHSVATNFCNTSRAPLAIEWPSQTSSVSKSSSASARSDSTRRARSSITLSGKRPS